MPSGCRSRTALLVGPRDAGKTTYARQLSERAVARGLRVAGFISEGERLPDGTKRYWLRDLADPHWRVPLSSPMPGPGFDVRIGCHHLSSQAFTEAAQRLRGALTADLVCIDEFGPLELQGGGFRPLCEQLWREYHGILLLTVRPAVLAPLLQLLRETAGPGRLVED